MTSDGRLTLIVPADQDAATALCLVHGPTDVDVGKLQGELEKVQGQIADLLKAVKDPAGSGFRLKTIEVALGVTGQGSIGIATAGVEASLTLSFERVP
jgi:hypothetical protein